MKYTFRPSAFDKTTKVTLADDGLLIEKEGRSLRTIAYKEIATINPKFIGSKNYPNMFQTNIVLNSGEELVIKNHHYKGIANLEDISGLYTPFILQLHKQVNMHNPSVTFKKGYQPFWYKLFMALFYFSLIAIVVIMSGLLFGALFLPAGVLGLSLFFIFRSANQFKKRNRPTIYTIENIPPDLLPGV